MQKNSSISFILLACLFYMPISNSYADVITKLQEVGEMVSDGDSSQAEQYLNNIITLQVGTDAALEAKGDLACLCIVQGEFTEAENITNELVADSNPSNSQITKSVYDIADHYRTAKRYDKANQLYRRIITDWPNANQCMWAQMGVAITNIWLGNEYIEVKGDIETLQTNYAAHEDIAEATCYIADEYLKYSDPLNAKQLYQQVVDTWPGEDHAMWSRMGVAVSGILLGEDPNTVDKEVEKLFTDYEGHGNLNEAAFWIAQKYYEQACQSQQENEIEHSSQKALVLWKRIRDELPATTNDMINCELYLLPAESYLRMGQYQNAIGHYEKVIADWPGSDFASFAKLKIGRCYEGLQRIGVISKAEANFAIEPIYLELASNYLELASNDPNAPPTMRIAQKWLDNNSVQERSQQ